MAIASDEEAAAWYTGATEVTLATLAEFVRGITEDFEHDAGTLRQAFGAAALAASQGVNAAADDATGWQTGTHSLEIAVKGTLNTRLRLAWQISNGQAPAESECALILEKTGAVVECCTGCHAISTRQILETGSATSDQWLSYFHEEDGWENRVMYGCCAVINAVELKNLE
jgi:hypothetical protein